MYYSLNEVRTYNKLYNFILSGRGGGKTYAAKLVGIKSYLKNKEQFVYVRRYKTEFSTIELFFNDIIQNDEFPEYEFKANKKNGFIRKKGEKDWDIICFFIPLSIQQVFKSTPYPRVSKIFFDEFIIDKGNITYLNNEPIKMLELCSTIMRRRENVRVFFLGNNISLVNPYFSFFNINIEPGKEFVIPKNNDEIVVQLYSNQDFENSMKATKFGKLIKGTIYEGYSICNETLSDNKEFIIEKRPQGNSIFICSFKIGYKEIGIWEYRELGFYYVDFKIDENSKNRYTLTKEDHSPNYTLIDIAKTKPFIPKIKKCYSEGLCNFSNQEVKNLFIHSLRYL